MSGNGSEQRRVDAESRAIIYDGASVSQLGKMFGMDNRNVAEKIRHVAPVGERAGHPIYAVRDAARYLVPPANEDEIIAYIQRMNPREMPAAVNKDFWYGVKARREYEHYSGDLWSTEEVKLCAAEAFKHIRLALLMLADRVGQQSKLTEEQRRIIQSETDRAMEDARVRLVDAFGKSRVPGRVVPGGDESEDGGL